MRVQVVPNTELAVKIENVIDTYKEEFPQVEPKIRPAYPSSALSYATLPIQFLHNVERLKYKELTLFFERQKTVYYELSFLHIYFPRIDELTYKRDGKVRWCFHHTNPETNPLARSEYAPTFERISQNVCEIFEGYKLHPDFVL